MKRLLITLVFAIAVLTTNAQDKFSREQAFADLDSLVYVLSEVHPNMFTVTSMGEFMSRVQKVQNELPDSLTRLEMYDRFAPLVSSIGDGHTMMWFPFNDLFTKELHRLPLTLGMAKDGTGILVQETIDERIPEGAEIISINGVKTEQMLDWMTNYASGERQFFRRARLNYNLQGLFEMRYNSDNYDIVYKVGGKKRRIALAAMPVSEIYEKTLPAKQEYPTDPRDYYLDIPDGVNYAVMTFNAFNDKDKMVLFADSMVAELNHRKIKSLIIDIRNNGGGDSRVGDELLSRISPVPFCQFGSVYCRITPTTISLLQEEAPTGIYFYDRTDDPDALVQPLPAEKRFNGDVYLLISHRTFSSAASFAWAFKYFGIGKVVGEEAGGMNVSFGDILQFSLPNSDLQISVSFKRFWLYGADENNVHGTLPDYEVPQTDALNFTINLIKRHK